MKGCNALLLFVYKCVLYQKEKSLRHFEKVTTFCQVVVQNVFIWQDTYVVQQSLNSYLSQN